MTNEALQVITNHVLNDVTYCGIPTRKNPLDAWVYQELIWKVRPDCVIEFGTFMGGSALMFLHMLQHVCNNPAVVTVDIDTSQSQVTASYANLTVLHGSATEANVANMVRLMVGGKRVMIVEDSSHECANTLAILRMYHDLVPVGSYFIVEDTICHHGLEVGPTPGPYEAVQQFLAENDKFVVDTDCEKFGLTYNPNGFLRRVK